VADAVVGDDDDAQPGFRLTERLPHRSRRDRLDITVARDGIAMIVTREQILHARLPEQLEEHRPPGLRDVEVLIVLSRVLQEPGVMLEDHDVLRAGLTRLLELRPCPALLR